MKSGRSVLGRGLTGAKTPSAPRGAPQVSRAPVVARTHAPDASGADARKYPRADLQVKVRLSLAGQRERSFEAALPTTNISVGGMFLESTFFLKIGTELDVELELPISAKDRREVRARGQVVRIETRAADATTGNSGFAVRFTEYFDGSEVVLATYFLAPVLREFIQQYAREHGLRANDEYIEQTADVLAAWELKKAELGSDVWKRRVTGPGR